MNISDPFDAYKAILEALPDRVFIISQFGVVIETMGGDGSSITFNKDKLVGHNLADIVGNKEAKQFMSVIQRAIVENTSQVYKYSISPQVIQDLSGSELVTETQWFEGRIKTLPFTLNGEAVVVWISRNTTKNHLLQEELKEQAELDYLTGTLSHRSFFTRALHCFNCQKQYCKATSLLLIDIDFFKSVNDTYGHLAGDAVLKQTAATLKETLRDVDFLGRVGGEEFAVLLPGTELEEAFPVAERIRTTIEEMLTHYKSESIKITISIGVSHFLTEDSDITMVYERADKALYQSKQAGRNQTTVYKEK